MPYALFNAGRKPQREDNMKWLGPLTNEILHFYELTSVPTGDKTRNEAKGFSICTGIGGYKDDVATQNGFHWINHNINDSACFKMLGVQRVKLVVASEFDLTGLLKKASVSPNLVQKLYFPLHHIQGYIAFTNNIPDRVIQQWRSVLDQLKAPGRYDELVREYLHSESKKVKQTNL
jgi:polar amino acid transport system substrate-binding protein